MTDMEEIIARAIRDTHGTPADIAQALTQAGYGRVDVAPTPDEPTQPVPDELVEAVREYLESLDAVDTEAERAEANGGKGWSSAPVVASMIAKRRVEAALSSLPDPLPTVESVRADERDRLLCLALGSEEDDYYARDGYVAEWLRSHTQGET